MNLFYVLSGPQSLTGFCQVLVSIIIVTII